MLGPVMPGDRVEIRPLREEDPAAHCRWFADRVVTRFLASRHPTSLKREEERLRRLALSNDDVVWAITRRGESTAIGTVGLYAISSRNRFAELAFTIGERDEWGKGYASEAIELATQYAFRELGLHKTFANVIAGNGAARRAVEKNGYRECVIFRRARYVDGDWQDLWMAELLDEEWSVVNPA